MASTFEWDPAEDEQNRKKHGVSFSEAFSAFMALGKPIAVNGETMGKAETRSEDLDLRPHYDFSGGVRGKYVERFAGGCTVVVLDPDVAEVFPDAASVNETLRELIASRGGRTRGRD